MLLDNKKCAYCQASYDPTLEQCPSCHRDNELLETKGFLKNGLYLHPIAQIGLFLAGFAYVGMLLAEIISSSFVMSISNDILRKALALFFTYLMMLFGLSMIVIATRRKAFLNRYNRSLDYLFGIAYAVGLVLVGLIISVIVSLFYKGEENANQSTAITISLNYPIIAGFILCLFGPICEEFTYRVGLYSFLRRINFWFTMIVSVIIFALIHFDFGATDMISELWSLPSYIVSAIILAVAYEHRGPACSMTAHVVYNTFAFIMIFLQK